MHVKLEILENEPIAILTYWGHLSDGIPAGAAQKNLAQLAASHEPIYLIIDIRDTNTSFEDFIDFLRFDERDHEYQAQAADLLAAPPVFIGNNILVDTFASNGLKRLFGVDQAPTFDNLEDAVNYVRKLLEKKLI